MYHSVLVAHDGTSSGEAALRLAERLRAVGGRLRIATVRPAAARTPYALAGGELIELAGSSVTSALTDLAEAEQADLLVIGPTHRSRLGRALHGTTGQHLLHGAPCAVAVANGRVDGIERIGIAYDGTEEAELALTSGCALARHLGADVVLLCVIPPVLAVEDGVTVAVDTGPASGPRRRAAAMLDEAAARAGAGLTVSRRVLVGRPTELLPRVAAELVDLLITGSRGHGAVRRVMLGSVSTALVGAATVPVLITPRGSLDAGGVHPVTAAGTSSSA